MLESEAKKKWCPFARIVDDTRESGAFGPYNRLMLAEDDTTEDTLCIRACCVGSDCMAWLERRDGGICLLMREL